MLYCKLCVRHPLAGVSYTTRRRLSAANGFHVLARQQTADNGLISIIRAGVESSSVEESVLWTSRTVERAIWAAAVEDTMREAGDKADLKRPAAKRRKKA